VPSNNRWEKEWHDGSLDATRREDGDEDEDDADTVIPFVMSTTDDA
jgi:hypothetical protein